MATAPEDTAKGATRSDAVLSPYGAGSKRFYRQLEHSSIGIQFAVSIALGLAAGMWADRYFHSAPWLLFAGLALGSFAGFRALYQVALKSSQEDRIDQANDRKAAP